MGDERESSQLTYRVCCLELQQLCVHVGAISHRMAYQLLPSRWRRDSVTLRRATGYQSSGATRLLETVHHPIASELAKRGHEIAFCSPAEAPSKLIAETGFDNLA